jgi:hypothetical protein
MSSLEWNYADQLDELRRCICSDWAAHCEGAIKRIRTNADQLDWRKQWISGEMDLYGQWLSAQGLMRIAVESSDEGRLLLCHGLQWRFWGYWIAIESNCHYSPARRGRSWPMGSLLIEEVGFLFLQAFATKCDDVAMQTGEWLTWYLDDRGLRGWDWSWPIQTFALAVFCRWQKRTITPPRTLPPLGPFEGAFKYWDHSAQFANALLEICDYHCQCVGTELTDDIDLPDFHRYPEQVLPVEILALRRLREDDGYSFLEIRHPLTETPWYRALVSSTFHSSNYPLLDEVRAYFPRILEVSAQAGSR